MMTKYKIINPNNNNGDIIEEKMLLKLIEICEKRHNEYYLELIAIWEYLEGAKYKSPRKNKNGKRNKN